MRVLPGGAPAHSAHDVQLSAQSLAHARTVTWDALESAHGCCSTRAWRPAEQVMPAGRLPPSP